MKRIFTIARRAAAVLALAALGAAALSSCKPEKKDPVQLTAPQPSLSASTINSLTFTWSQVANAAQYTYELLSSDGSQAGNGSTAGTTAEFTGLKDNTAYTFKVVANPATGSEDYLASAAGQCVGTTSAITPLATPALKVEVADNSATISWDAVQNAESYVYSVADGGKSGTTAETSVKLELDPGKYTFTLYATTTNEAYTDSEKASVEFEIAKTELWRVTGIFFDGAGKYWNADLVAMADGSYSLKNWYNVEGYDLNFTVDSKNNDELVITNAKGVDEYSYYYINAGLSEDVYIYTISKYSNFTGNQNGGELYFYNYTANASSTFQWPAPQGSAVTADKIAGTYSQNSSYYYYYTSWEAYTSDNDVTVAKVDDTNITITGIIGSDWGTLNATLDPATGIITIAPQAYYGWTLGGCSELSPVVGAYKDGVITLNGWNLWYKYEGYSYYSQYTYDTKTTLTKK